MNNDLQSQIDAFQGRFESLITQIETAQRRLEQDIMDDLSALEPQVAKLCHEVQTSEPPVARAVQSIMGDLIAKLDAFERELNDFAKHDKRIQS